MVNPDADFCTIYASESSGALRLEGGFVGSNEVGEGLVERSRKADFAGLV